MTQLELRCFLMCISRHRMENIDWDLPLVLKDVSLARHEISFCPENRLSCHFLWAERARKATLGLSRPAVGGTSVEGANDVFREEDSLAHRKPASPCANGNSPSCRSRPEPSSPLQVRVTPATMPVNPAFRLFVRTTSSMVTVTKTNLLCRPKSGRQTKNEEKHKRESDCGLWADDRRTCFYGSRVDRPG